MKKIFSTFVTLACYLFILVLPIFLGLHASMMSDHGMSAGECIEHCMSGEAHLSSPKIISLGAYFEIFVAKIFFTKIFECTLPLILIYVLLSHAPPNLLKNIKNYTYSSLIGIIKLTT